MFDLAIARNIRIGGDQQLPAARSTCSTRSNQAIITNRNTTVSLTSPLDGTMTNLPFDVNGNPIATRSQPKNAGFGVATNYQAPRTLQAQIRFSF